VDFSKLDQNERMAAIAAAVLVIAGFVAAATYSIYSMSWLAVLAGLGLLFVVLQPQIAAGVSLPGTKGSLMLLLGGIAGIVMVLALLVSIGLVFVSFGFADIMFLAAVVAGVAAAWAGWQAFQAEGGKFQLGTSAAGTSTSSAAPSAEERAAQRPADDRPFDGPGTDETPEERRTEA
jgi:hypothetical protein